MSVSSDDLSSFSFAEFWKRQKSNMDSVASNAIYRINASFERISHITSIMNKWTQRVLEGSALAAGVQELLVGIQMAQMGVAATSLSIKSAAAFATGHPGLGAYLAVLAGDMYGEMIFLTAQRESAKAAKNEAEVQAAAVKTWRESYN